MDFHEKLKIDDSVSTHTSSPQLIRDQQYSTNQQRNEPSRTYRYQSHSVERPPSAQNAVPARARIRQARSKAANIRSRSRGKDFKNQHCLGVKYHRCQIFQNTKK